MARQRRTDGNLRCFRVPNLSHHHDIRVLTQNGAQTVGESEIPAGAHGDLRHSRKLVLDRVLDGQDFQFRRVNALKDRVKRGRFAATCWTGGQEKSVRLFHHSSQQRRPFRIQPQLLRSQHLGVFFQQTHDQALPINRRHGAHPNVHSNSPVMDLDMAILRHEPFGDVHVRHDLHPGYQGGVQLFGWRGLLLQQTINAVAQLKNLFEWNQMNVACAFPERGGNDEVDQVDHRGFIGHHLDVVQVPVLDRGALLRIEVLNHLLHRHLVALADLFQDLRSRGLELLHFQATQQPNVIDHPLVAGLGRGNVNCALVNLQRQNPVTLHEIRRERAYGFRGYREPGKALDKAPARPVRLKNGCGVLLKRAAVALRVSFRCVHLWPSRLCAPELAVE